MRNSPIRITVGWRGAVMTALAIVASGCTLVRGGPSDPGPDALPAEGPAEEGNLDALRSYGGSVTFDGDRISLVLDLVGSDSEFSARMSIPSLDLDAGGAGNVDGERLSVELSYPGTCPGHLRLTGRIHDGMRRIEGRLMASDCTGEEEGAVVLLLRPGS